MPQNTRAHVHSRMTCYDHGKALRAHDARRLSSVGPTPSSRPQPGLSTRPREGGRAPSPAAGTLPRNREGHSGDECARVTTGRPEGHAGSGCCCAPLPGSDGKNPPETTTCSQARVPEAPWKEDVETPFPVVRRRREPQGGAGLWSWVSEPSQEAAPHGEAGGVGAFGPGRVAPG